MIWLRSIILAASILACPHQSHAQNPQPLEPQSSLIIGTTTLRLGLARASILPALALQGYEYFPVDCLKSDPTYPDQCLHYGIWGNTAPKDQVASVRFDVRGNLVNAYKEWTPGQRPYSGVEIGQILITILATLVTEGSDHCSVVAQLEQLWLKGYPNPLPAAKVGRIKCGDKTIVIGGGVGYDDVFIREEIGTHPPDDDLIIRPLGTLGTTRR